MESAELVQLERRFDAAMEGIYHAAVQDCAYRATRFLQMVHTFGGLQTARRLLESNELSDGLVKLWECGRLDLSLEWLVQQSEWAPLFTESERLRAELRLRELGFPPAGAQSADR